MIYCDASLIVTLLVKETYSLAAERWIRAQAASSLFTSDWVGLEVESALAQKFRRGALDEPSFGSTRQRAARMLGGFRSVRIEAHHFGLAGDRYVSAPPRGLRAGDALHLAIAIDRGFTMATLDKQLAEASRQQGVEVASILEP